LLGAKRILLPVDGKPALRIGPPRADPLGGSFMEAGPAIAAAAADAAAPPPPPSPAQQHPLQAQSWRTGRRRPHPRWRPASGIAAPRPLHGRRSGARRGGSAATAAATASAAAATAAWPASTVAQEARSQAIGTEGEVSSEDVVEGMATILRRLVVAAGRADASAPQGLTPFHARSVPKVSLDFYLRRIRQHLPCSDACFVLALVYLDRVARRDARTAANELTAHRLVLTAVMLAMRFLDDPEEVHYNNAWFAKLGGLVPGELRALEQELLQRLEWRLFVPEAEYAWQLERVRSAAAAAATVASVDKDSAAGQGAEGTPASLCGQMPSSPRDEQRHKGQRVACGEPCEPRAAHSPQI